MANISQLRKKFQAKFGQKQDALPFWEAVLGDGDGNVQVPGDGNENLCYVRVGEFIQEVLNTRMPYQEGLRVVIGFDPNQPSTIQVLGTSSPNPMGDSGRQVNEYAPASWYEYEGQDPIFIDKRLWLPRRVSIISSTDPAYDPLSVRIYQDIFWNGTGWIEFLQQDIDLSASIPASEDMSKWVLITIDTTGTVITTDGLEVATVSIAVTDIPVVPVGTYDVLAAVQLYHDMTVIQDAVGASAILDLRFTYHG